jgi:hypothetical protein
MRVHVFVQDMLGLVRLKDLQLTFYNIVSTGIYLHNKLKLSFSRIRGFQVEDSVMCFRLSQTLYFKSVSESCRQFIWIWIQGQNGFYLC